MRRRTLAFLWCAIGNGPAVAADPTRPSAMTDLRNVNGANDAVD